MLSIITNTLITLVAVFHIGFLVLEMFLWTKPVGLKIFVMDESYAMRSQRLAENMGLYNGFLAAGILFALISQNLQMLYFMLICVVIAGLYGALRVNKIILFVQALPAILALIFLLL